MLNGVLRDGFIQSFADVALSPDPDLAVAALMIARIEYPHLDAGRYIDRLDELGYEAERRVKHASTLPHDAPRFIDPLTLAQITALSDYLFQEQHFIGNQRQYEDPRNSFLNEVLDRRTGIPITLALVFMEVARRAGVRVEGVNFPGHFLVRCRAPRRTLDDAGDLIIDAFHGGAILSEEACRELLRRHTGEDAHDDIRRMAHATKPQILVRMLLNLKRTYVKMYSFPQARDVTELLLAVNPSGVSELRDRGLLAYHMHDFHAALRDLQAYLDVAASVETDKDEHEQIWEHVKTLKRRVASLN
jgi:regulator of sirC expression with transglutaminase-like and TPR domain